MQSPDKDTWLKEIKNEKLWLDKYNALTPVPWSFLPQWSKVLTSHIYMGNARKIQWNMSRKM
jgi:hypothetical protein